MNISFISCFLVLGISIYGMCFNKNIVKSIICLNMMQSALILLFLNYGDSVGEGIPIIGDVIISVVDPLPQALMITAVVIGASITSLALMLSVKIFHYFGTLSWDALRDIEC